MCKIYPDAIIPVLIDIVFPVCGKFNTTVPDTTQVLIRSAYGIIKSTGEAAGIKWEALLKRADMLGCDLIATGHYAKVREENGRYVISKGLVIPIGSKK